MKPIPVLSLALAATVAAGVGAALVAVLMSMGHTPPAYTPFMGLLSVGLTIALWWCGIHVRKMRRREDTWMHPLVAVRVAAMSRASTIVGSMMTGFLIGTGLVFFVRAEAEYLLHAALTSMGLALCSLAWTVAGAVVERWCVRDADDDDPREGPIADDTSPTPA